MRKVFTENLPHYQDGNLKGYINWSKSVGERVKIVYDNIEGEILIKENKDKNHIIVVYNDKEFTISKSHFKDCNISHILNYVEWNYEIGEVIKDEKRDLKIIKREFREFEKGHKRQFYKYHCNKCGAELWTQGNKLKSRKDGCSCCSGKSVIKGINDIATTDKWLIPIIKDDIFCETHSKGSNAKIKPYCTICNKQSKKEFSVSTIFYNGYSCPHCNDGISYPNKFMNNLLKQLMIEYENEKLFTWCKYNIKNKSSFGVYDFYIPSINLIIEMDGGFHTSDNKMNGKTKEESKLIDEYKDKLAEEHGIEVIRIDCDYKNIPNRFSYIKNNIVNSQLNTIFNLSNIDWNSINRECEKNLLKIVCGYYEANKNKTISDLEELFKLNRTTIRYYLQKGEELGFCSYSNKDYKTRTFNKKLIFIKHVCEIYNNNIDKTFTEISRELQIGRTTLRNYLKIGNEKGWCSYPQKNI